ncbi:MAG: hypothetical protein MJE77_28795 [Proteobacteria bacterium]|nr:hypothetical protein [Pseudomonadota bacterium]
MQRRRIAYSTAGRGADALCGLDHPVTSPSNDLGQLVATAPGQVHRLCREYADRARAMAALTAL